MLTLVFRAIWLGFLATFALCPPAIGLAQDDPVTLEGPSYANPVTSRWKIGATIKGGQRPATNILMTIPVPNDWPEQHVTFLEEDIPPDIGTVQQRELEYGVKQIVIRMPRVNAGEEITVSVTCEVSVSEIQEPQDTSGFVAPKSSHKEGRLHLGISPQINHRNSKLRKQVRELIADKESPWEQVEQIYDWVRDNVDSEAGKLKGALQTFEDRAGSNQDRVFLFVGMCRAAKIPARIVFARGHYYAEFLLTDADQDASFWFPCNVNGIREFGFMAEPRIVLQKGEYIKVPEKRERQKFVAEFLTCQGTSRPTVKFFRELLPTEGP